MTTDPFALFDAWLAEARTSEPNDANAMALATTTPDGHPSLRMVLLKGHGPGGFVFYTNLDSRKGNELAANPHVALLFHWKSLRRQVRIEGPVSGNVLLRRAQYRVSESDPTDIARGLLLGKIANQRSVLMRTLRDHEVDEAAGAAIEAAADRLVLLLRRVEASAHRHCNCAPAPSPVRGA